MLRRFALLFFLAFSVLSLTPATVSCSEHCGSPDSVAVLDERNGIFLVYRVSGLQDKMEFFETYQGKPKFDACGSSQMSAMATEPYERSQGLLKKLQFRQGRLKVIYTHRRSEAIKPSHARLSR